MNHLTELFGNYGTITIDPDTGEVLSYRPADDWEKPGDGYEDILCVDLAEWREFLARNNLTEAPTEDILNVGFWTTSGLYCEPAPGFREDWLPDFVEGGAATRVS